MEDLRPSRPTSVELMTTSDRNQPEDGRPQRTVNHPKRVPRRLQDPLLDADAEKELKHELDELA